jgi:hypothetical protein
MQKEPDKWYIGFRCGHSEDMCPQIVEDGFAPFNEVYRGMEYVEGEIKSLIDQIENQH